MKTLKQMKQQKEFQKLNKIVGLNKGNNLDICYKLKKIKK